MTFNSKNLLLGFLTGSVFASACDVSDETSPLASDSDMGGDKADQISGQDDPSGILADAERRLSKLISVEDIGQTFGLPDERIPYPDTYWPMVVNGIDVQWLEKSGQPCADFNGCTDPDLSPLEKYMTLTDPQRIAVAKEWELNKHGSARPGVADWYGHCNGWTGAAIFNDPLKRAVRVKSPEAGVIAECAPDEEEGCITFTIGDINGLQAEIFLDASSKFIGARCDTSPDDIQYDEYGRILRTGNGAGCKGLNAGSMLILMANMLRDRQEAFAIDAQQPFSTDQIWNQPAYRYKVHDYKQISKEEATSLVASGLQSMAEPPADYIWNTGAQGFALVDFELFYVVETSRPNLSVVNGGDYTHTSRMVAVIELDAPASDPEAAVIGGEYLDKDEVDANRLTVHPFVWIPGEPGEPRGRGAHNQYVASDMVMQIVALAQQDAPAPQ